MSMKSGLREHRSSAGSKAVYVQGEEDPIQPRLIDPPLCMVVYMYWYLCIKYTLFKCLRAQKFENQVSASV